MNINATIIVQACNFLIAYLIIKRILLKPALHEIHEQEAEVKLLRSAAHREKERFEETQAERLCNWDACRAYFKRNVPQPLPQEYHVFRNITPRVYQDRISPEQRAECVRELSDRIVDHVDGGTDAD